MTPDELKALLKRNSLSKARAAEVTGYDENSVHAWTKPATSRSHRGIPDDAARLLRAIDQGHLVLRTEPELSTPLYRRFVSGGRKLLESGAQPNNNAQQLGYQLATLESETDFQLADLTVARRFGELATPSSIVRLLRHARPEGQVVLEFREIGRQMMAWLEPSPGAVAVTLAYTDPITGRAGLAPHGFALLTDALPEPADDNQAQEILRNCLHSIPRPGATPNPSGAGAYAHIVYAALLIQGMRAVGILSLQTVEEPAAPGVN